MNPYLTLSVIVAFFGLLMVISYLTGRNADTNTFFSANKQSPWYLVAFGMIGSSLSGVTFISIPGKVGVASFSYMQIVLGYLVGYAVIATVLMPLYYRLNLISIYAYLEDRFGFWAYKTGAFFFMISRLFGSSVRLFLVAGVLQYALFDSFGIPFWASVMMAILLIWVYTHRGGMKTIVWTDTLQTFFMLTAVGVSIYLIDEELGVVSGNLFEFVQNYKYTRIFFFDDPNSKDYFFKQFIAGAFIAIVMTGLDQDMMQKNLTCRNIGEAQKNMFWFSITLVLANFCFMIMGALLYAYAESKGIAIPARTDDLYPMLALNYFGPVAGILFILGIIAAAYSSADSALAALTTSFCVDFLEFKKRPEVEKKKIKSQVHIGFSVLTFLIIILFRELNNSSVIDAVFIAAGYTYGPLLGLYAFGLFTKIKVRDKFIPFICVISPLLTFLIDRFSTELLGGYKFGFELLLVNGFLTFMGLLAASYSLKSEQQAVAGKAFSNK